MALRGLLATLLALAALWLVRPGDAPGAPPPLTWSALLAPHTAGAPLAGHRLGPLRRGDERDLVVTARHPVSGRTVELHVLDRGRWPGVRETASFAVAWEEPRTTAPREDAEAVTQALRDALAARDPGGLGPVGAIPLEPEPDAPAAARWVARLAGPRGALAGLCLAGALGLVASLPGGAALAALLLFALGLWLRAAAAGVPFVRDQDVQRLFTGHLPLGAVLGGQGLDDRHPPLYFVLLHAAQGWGQAEAVVRAPAILCGALGGPLVVLGARALGRSVPLAALAGLALTVSVELVGAAREVSPLPLVALLGLGLALALIRAADAPGRSRAAATLVALGVALLLWSTYLGAFAVLGALAGLWLARRPLRPLGAPLAVGLLLGAPALVLGARAFLRDRPARLAAAADPALAWGDRGAGEMARALGELGAAALGPTLLAMAALAALRALWRRDPAVLVPAGALLATAGGLIALAPWARLQPYTLLGALPLGALALGLALPAKPRGLPRLGPLVVAAVVGLGVVPRLAEARPLYLAHPDAVMPALARQLVEQPERRVALAVHYDAPLLAYYLGRAADQPVDWSSFAATPGTSRLALTGLGWELWPLTFSHGGGPAPDVRAARELEALASTGPVLVLVRETPPLPALEERLRRCAELAERGPARLLRCAP